MPTTSPEAPPAAELPKVSSEILEVDDGCLCGRVEGVRWVADRSGLVEFLRPVDAELVEKVRAEVAAHYQAKSKRPPARAARAAATPRKPGRGRRAESTPAEAPKRRGRKAESTPAEPPKRRGRPPGSKNKPKPEPAKKAEEKQEAPVKKRRGRPPGSKNKPKAEKSSGTSGAEEAGGNEKTNGNGKMNGNGNGTTSGNGKPNGNGAAKAAGQALEWTEVGENFRASVPSGYFEIVPEGSDYALYFADLNGSSTFLKNGEKSTLMQVAAERNSRGMGAAPAAVASTNLDELFAQAIRG